jgi:hypothetical protein
MAQAVEHLVSNCKALEGPTFKTQPHNTRPKLLKVLSLPSNNIGW